MSEGDTLVMGRPREGGLSGEMEYVEISKTSFSDMDSFEQAREFHAGRGYDEIRWKTTRER